MTYPELKGIISNGNPSWRTALGNLNAVYLQVDKETGKKYVWGCVWRAKVMGGVGQIMLIAITVVIKV